MSFAEVTIPDLELMRVAHNVTILSEMLHNFTHVMDGEGWEARGGSGAYMGRQQAALMRSLPTTSVVWLLAGLFTTARCSSHMRLEIIRQHAHTHLHTHASQTSRSGGKWGWTAA